MSFADFYALSTRDISLVFDCRGLTPRILYWGKKLPEDQDFDQLASLVERSEAPASAETDPPLALTPLIGQGFMGYPGLELSGEGAVWGCVPVLQTVDTDTENHIVFTSVDQQNGVELQHTFTADCHNNVIVASTGLKNIAEHPLRLSWCAAPCFPIDSRFTAISSFEGRWATEFSRINVPRSSGTYLRENRKGRTSHNCFPGILMTAENTSDSSGEVMAFHLGWSGNSRMLMEDMDDARGMMLAGELLLPDEIHLAKNQRYQSPSLYCSYADQGLNRVRQNYHQFVRDNLLLPSVKNKARPIHFNTWEALYFNHDMATLSTLVEEAAGIGAERFILDDGWFPARRNDKAGLGDWFVDKDIYPEGLSPLIDKVKAAGLEFGLWFEPEMVNPDSTLYRQHPDWVLKLPHVESLKARNQLVLDLGRQEVYDYLYERLDSLLNEYDIDYIKWDMNRDIHQPGNAEHKPGVNTQTLAVYKLIKALGDAHPKLEIESCASGGGRVDYGILPYTHRFWTSDSNDALDRLNIQAGFLTFFPPELMGSHVGPYECHITGRKLDMETRVATALFGHMGIEANLLDMNAKEKHTLKTGLALHKRFRHVIHQGVYERFDCNEDADFFAFTTQDGAEALYAYTSLATNIKTQMPVLRLPSAHLNGRYQIRLVWPPATPALEEWAARFADQSFSGELLAQSGFQLPLMKPYTGLIFHVTKIN